MYAAGKLAGLLAVIGFIVASAHGGPGSIFPGVRYRGGEESCYAYGVAAGDLDGDDVPDLAVTYNITDKVAVRLGLGDGTFAAPTLYAVGDRPRSVAIGDLDGDGHADLAVTNGGIDRVSVLRGLGDGSFGAYVTHQVGNRPVFVALGDLDGDGRADLAAVNLYGDTVGVLLNHTRSCPGDLDGDGDVDLSDLAALLSVYGTTCP